MKKTVLLIIIITIFSKFFGLFRDLTMSYFYGTSYVSDVYLIATIIPGTIFGFVGAGIKAGYIPMYNNIKTKTSKVSAEEFTNKLITFISLICLLLFIIGFVFTKEIVKVFASGFEGETLITTVKYTRITLGGIFFIAYTNILSGYLQNEDSFVVPALIGFPMNFLIIIAIFLSYHINEILLPIGFIIAGLLQVLFLLPFAKKKKFNIKFDFHLKDSHIKELMLLAIPTIIGISVNQINILVDRTIASNIVIGGISALNYSNNLSGLIQSIFVISILSVMYPTISKVCANSDANGFQRILHGTITVIEILVIPASIGFVVFAKPITALFYGRGAFDVDSIKLTSSALLFYSVGMIGIALREVLSRVFYAMQDTKTPMINAALGMVINIVLNIILSRYLGIGGLALATSIAATFTTILLFISLRKKIGPFGMKQISISFLKILFASLVMGGLAKLSFNYLTSSISQNLSLLIAIGVGAVSYFVIIYFMKIEDVDVIVGAIKKKLGRGAT